MILYGALTVCLLWCLPETNCRADDGAVDFDYDIFIRQDSLTVWLDVSPVLTQALFEDLLAGLQIRIDIRCKAEYPPGPIFAKSIKETGRSVLFRRDVTGDFYELIEINGLQDTSIFQSQLDMADFLTDSIELPVTPISLVETGAKVRLQLEIFSKSMPYKKLAAPLSARPDDNTGDEQPAGQAVNTVFSLFLDFIGFGERKYQITTPVFKLSSLESYPGQD